jgi:predicted membrane channel-forming protein YqfA (hemolysin III family)
MKMHGPSPSSEFHVLFLISIHLIFFFFKEASKLTGMVQVYMGWVTVFTVYTLLHSFN